MPQSDQENLERLEKLQSLAAPGSSADESLAWAVRTIPEQAARIQEQRTTLQTQAGYVRSLEARIAELEAIHVMKDEAVELLNIRHREKVEKLEAEVGRLKENVPERLAELVIEKHRLQKALRTIAELQELNSVPIPRYEQARTIARRALDREVRNDKD